MSKIAEKPVKLDMTIGDVVEKYPESAEVMLGYGLHCVGCAVNPYETIEQGAMGHGMSRELIDTMLDDINLMVTKQPEYPLNPEGITLSPRAVDTLEAIAEADGKQGHGLKIKATEVDGALDYFLDLVEKPEAGDKTLEWDGLKMFMDEASFALMNPSLIDFVKMPEGEGFKVISLKPGEKKAVETGCGDSCGCGPKGEHEHGEHDGHGHEHGNDCEC